MPASVAPACAPASPPPRWPSDADGPVCVGSHQPVGDVTEIVGVGTPSCARRHGLGAAVTSRVVEDADDRSVGTVFLSAGSEDIARVYARLGLRRIGTACIAEPATGRQG